MDNYKLNSATETASYKYIAKKGLTRELVMELSASKNEPEWMLQKRLEALEIYQVLSIPEWGVDMFGLKWEEICYYLGFAKKFCNDWDDVPKNIRRVFERVGAPYAEKEYFAGVAGQYDSEKVYGSLKKNWVKKGVIFLSMDEALRDYPEIVRKYWGSVVAVENNKFSALNGAVWSGGSFVYVPEGVKVELPLSAYFWINTESAGQFERTLIVVEKGASVHYLEGCSAAMRSGVSLHAGVVEIVIKKKAKCRYTTVQNWYKNVYNFVTKGAEVGELAKMEWVDANIGSRATMKYPTCLLKGEGASGLMLSIAVAGKDQQLDTGAKMIHLAPDTTSEIVSKSISRDGGRSSYRGLVSIASNATGSKSRVVCDTLILDSESRSDTYPTNRVMTVDAQLEHEAYASKISEEEVQYLMSRGMTEGEAQTMIVRGFLGEVISELPMEYSVELNRLVKLEMINSVG